MKLYFKPGACSQATHIILRELGLDFTLEQVDTDKKRTASGENYLKVSPNGYVPSLQLKDGEIITENPAVLQYLADAHPFEKLAPPNGTLQRTRLQTILNFLSSELHVAFGPFFSGRKLSETEKTTAEAAVQKCFKYLEDQLKLSGDYLVGGEFSVADALAFVMSSWAAFVGISTEQWPQLEAFLARIAQRPTVIAARKAEGLA